MIKNSAYVQNKSINPSIMIFKSNWQSHGQMLRKIINWIEFNTKKSWNFLTKKGNNGKSGLILF